MIYFTGDICLTDNDFDAGYGVGSKIAKGLNPFQHIYKRKNDVWIGNFEGVTSHTSNRKGWNRRCFNIAPEQLRHCSDLIDYWNIANNHVMEHGADAYREMESVLSAQGKGCFGSCNHKHIVIENGGGKFGILSFSLRNDHTGTKPLYWNFPELTDIESELTKIKSTDFKIAYVHWGVEYVSYPSWQQQKLGHWLIDIGFDLVVGMHPHVLQGYEVYKGKHIFYSLGNFVFNMPYRPTHYGAVVGVDENSKDVLVEYVKIGEDYCPKFISEGEVPVDFCFSKLNREIPCYSNVETYISEASKGLKAFQKTNRVHILKNLHRYDRDVLMGMITDFLKRKTNKTIQHDTSNSHEWGGGKILFLPIVKFFEWLGNHHPVALLKLRYRIVFKKKLNLNNPQDLNEKILWAKLYSDTSAWTRLADKYEVRKYVEESGLGEHLVKLYAVWYSVEEVDFDALPETFIIKANNGDGKGTNKIIRKAELTTERKQELLKMIDEWLHRKNIGALHAEPHYKGMKPCVIAEEVLPCDPGATTLTDYKIWCFNGKAYYVWVCNDRSKSGNSAHVMTYDLKWNAHPEYSVFNSDYQRGEIIPKPQNLDEMIRVAEKLSQGFPELRVDLYNVQGKVYFGELTFTSQGGFMDYYTPEFNLILGQKFDTKDFPKKE